MVIVKKQRCVLKVLFRKPVEEKKGIFRGHKYERFVPVWNKKGEEPSCTAFVGAS